MTLSLQQHEITDKINLLDQPLSSRESLWALYSLTGITPDLGLRISTATMKLKMQSA